jgi:hypothetical protein
MSKFVTKILLLLIPILILSSPVIAQEDGANSVASFVGSYTLWAAIVIGFAASLATLFYAYRLQGGVVGVSLNFFGVGMLFIVLGFLTVVVEWSDVSTRNLVHDIVFILGYISMLIGAFRLRQIA